MKKRSLNPRLTIEEALTMLHRVARFGALAVNPARSLASTLLLCGAAALSCSSCAGPRAHPPGQFEGEYPGQLRPPEVLGLDVVWRQRVTAEWDDGEGQSGSRGFEAVVQKQGPLLTMVGLSPFGTVGFAILLSGVEVELRNESGEDLPFPPRFVLLDFQRVFYPWLAGSDGPLSDGEHTGEVGDERVHELWSGGRLIERRFRRLDRQPPGDLVVSYTWAGATADVPWSAPSQAVLENRWFGYKLVVDTLQETLLEPSLPQSGP